MTSNKSREGGVKGQVVHLNTIKQYMERDEIVSSQNINGD